MGYKDYQQILNLSRPTPAKSTRKSTQKLADCSSDNQAPVKRRTKTGCFTCRRRKKKCDMDKVDGKCQACIRNFLECSWPEPAECKGHKEHSTTIEVKEKPHPEVESEETKGASAYPSPIASPRSDYHSDSDEINSIQLPSNKNYKICKTTKQSTSPAESKTKFIITSFNRHKELCQVKVTNPSN